MKYAELRREVQRLEWERQRLERDLRETREWYALRLAGQQKQIEALCDPIVQAKMLQPPPPIVLQLPADFDRDALAALRGA